ncbi:unnamed protein product [Cylicocyclus nassatus]|uniref:Uncharacterized protein n=1 Tax=Cylicocyclus nassatus TaxID=53992 RepID=A0AA36H8H6_CYLNA|nr:unnamed protein product [Cylicocyclus nassatus]
MRLLNILVLFVLALSTVLSQSFQSDYLENEGRPRSRQEYHNRRRRFTTRRMNTLGFINQAWRNLWNRRKEQG